ncbi:hypothetical protein ABI59_08405 [Acidobacteria bacterium Mor1]|nr:hypothetical protein ABI59_08405 [Acidobacteria bacterium Mor1]
MPVACAVASCLAMLLGWQWDIQWHRCIGRDSTWTLPHVVIYISLIIAFIYASGLVLSFTFGKNKNSPALKVLGFRGPSGAFVTLWGMFLQLTAIVFDDWWHRVYGLDVSVFSPPHALLAWGITIFYFGQFMVVARYHNEQRELGTNRYRLPVLLIWGLFLAHLTIAVDPYYGPLAVRAKAFVISSATTFPFAMVLIQRYLRWRWAAAVSGALYVMLMLTLMQVFQLFPATPQFGPVYHEVEHFFPPLFPMLLFIPGLALAWMATASLKQRVRSSLRAGLAFVITFNVANWISSGIVVSPLGANRLLAGHVPASAFDREPRAVPLVDFDLGSILSFIIAIFAASLLAWLATYAGDWMRRVAR